MIIFKACPKCGGDMHKTSDMYGEYMGCIQCGYTRDLPRKPVKPSSFFRKQEAIREDIEDYRKLMEQPPRIV